MMIFFFSSRRRHTRCALVTGVQTCALPILQLSTVDPDRSYGGKIVLAKIMDKKLPKIVTINLDWNGERYPFSFRLVKPGTPAPEIGRASCRERVCQYV